MSVRKLANEYRVSPFDERAYREETSLKQSQDNAVSSKCMPIIRETHANHNSSPRNTQTSEEVAWTNLASKDSSRRLEDDVSGEEDERHSGLIITSQCQLMYLNGCSQLQHPAILTYLIPTVNSNSAFIPAIAALDKFDLSIRETQYMTPTTATSRLSRR